MAEEQIDEGLMQLAQNMSDALAQGMLHTMKTWRIPLATITIGMNRMDLVTANGTPYHLIEIKVWWTRTTIQAVSTRGDSSFTERSPCPPSL